MFERRKKFGAAVSGKIGFFREPRRQCKHPCARWVFVVAVAASLAACTDSKNLSPSSAKQLLQERLQADGRDNYVCQYAPTQAFIGRRTFTDYREDRFTGESAEAALHRLLKAGLAQQTTETTSFPNLTGTYGGRKPVDFNPLTLSMQQGSRAISGSYHLANPWEKRPNDDRWVCNGAVSGTLNSDGSVNLQFQREPNKPCALNPGGPQTWQVQRAEDGSGLKLVGHDEMGGQDVLYGAGSAGAIILTTYTYTFTPKFLELADVSSKTAKVGRVEIDGVTNLLLGVTETSAGGQYAWHVDYNATGQALLGGAGNRGTSQVEFRKQPDGRWVCVSY